MAGTVCASEATRRRPPWAYTVTGQGDRVSGDTFGQALRDSRCKRGLSLRKMQVLTSYDFTYLGQVERGEKPGSLDLAEMCDRALNMDGTLVEKYRRASAPPTRPTPQEDEMRRRTAIKAMAATPFALVDHDRGTGREPRVERLERRAEVYRHLYHGSAPGDLLALARDHLDEAADLMRDLSDGDLKRRALRTRSEVATLAGRLTFFDLRQPTEARGYYGLAHESASQAGDDLLAAAALGHLAFLPAAEGNASAAVDYLGAAARHARRTGMPLVQSWISAVESEVLTPVHPAWHHACSGAGNGTAHATCGHRSTGLVRLLLRRPAGRLSRTRSAPTRPVQRGSGIAHVSAARSRSGSG